MPPTTAVHCHDVSSESGFTGQIDECRTAGRTSRQLYTRTDNVMFILRQALSVTVKCRMASSFCDVMLVQRNHTLFGTVISALAQSRSTPNGPLAANSLTTEEGIKPAVSDLAINDIRGSRSPVVAANKEFTQPPAMTNEVASVSR